VKKSRKRRRGKEKENLFKIKEEEKISKKDEKKRKSL